MSVNEQKGVHDGLYLQENLSLDRKDYNGIRVLLLNLMIAIVLSDDLAVNFSRD
jgi:hypothetical protein